MRRLQLAIDAGEKNCARERGKWCRFMGRLGVDSSAPVCLLFRDKHGDPHALRDVNGDVEGWLQRLPECLAAEQAQSDDNTPQQPRVNEGRHDKVFAAVVRSGDDAAKLIDRLTVESFGWPKLFDREIVAFRKLNTAARLSAARSFLRRRGTTSR